MRVFVTGATGYIGSAVVRELVHAGHKVVGLTRSGSSAAMLKEVGVEIHHGALDDLDSLQSGAAAADGVIHLAFKHDFSNFDDALKTDLRAVESMGAVLKGSGKPFVITAHANGAASENEVKALAKRGARTSIVSLAPSVHGEGDKGFVPRLINIARDKGVSAYIGDGSNHWTAVHRLDAAHLFRLALEKAPAGSRLDGVADEGVPFRDIASVIGKHLNLPVVSISRDEAESHFGFLGIVAALDIPRSSVQTQELLGWHPLHRGLMADLEQGHYFKS
ncbi:SDR family oxidoreductase [Ferroacidibacillus organovorans]|uniref:3-beta hydroxysteroid dehydrogenase n=1 Tax=Ferroacidibacillus organovorans TaxID=1765683 RepID=A0A162TZS7_9BACL|nr:SDR family oxidoreductase [Ferroacidibacillus organovorans]KYP81283.1 3-beta hydroxysteroid dehydrogenase [Ferroacidibacillus organovorans]OAG95320.1 3-beta hydroxysteroid dehydrogenase [Ferroacidibacillus organovorans]OPG17136.1 3-beta hydroxysteroid dehydrogenase [Ferroacidibacillus organovorans]